MGVGRGTGTYHFSRTLPELEPVDVLVAGGGMAGFSAAIAAARQGARVLLVEQHADLGGTATTGGTAAFCGETTGQGEVFDAVVEELERLQAIAPYRPYEEREARPFDHEVLKMVLQEQALGAGVDLWLHTRVADVDAAGGRIGAVILHSKSGLQALRPAVVIDCHRRRRRDAPGRLPDRQGPRVGRGAAAHVPQLLHARRRAAGAAGPPAGPHRSRGGPPRLRGRRGPAHALGLAPGGRQGGAEAQGDRARRDGRQVPVRGRGARPAPDVEHDPLRPAPPHGAPRPLALQVRLPLPPDRDPGGAPRRR